MQVVSLQAYPCWLSGVASNRDILCWQNDVNRCSSSLYSRAGKLKLTIVIYGIITILKNLLLGFCIRQYKLTWTSKFSTDLIRWCVQLALAALHKSNDILKVFNFERYLETIFSRQHSDCTVEQFVQSIKSIHYLVDQLKIPTVKDMRHVDRKLKHCWDRSSHDEHKKKEKKSKHKSKRTSTDAQLNG